MKKYASKTIDCGSPADPRCSQELNLAVGNTSIILDSTSVKLPVTLRYLMMAGASILRMVARGGLI